jgi:2-dehydro-3-deoxyphosphogalactonate aldolase
MADHLADFLEPLPLVAVLRGITPEEIPAIGTTLASHGFRIIEVPLNSPRPFESIRRLAENFGDRCLVGAGTVIDLADVARVQAAGGRVIVMPHADAAVIREAKRLRLICLPGVATITEAFAALAAGADGLKMFPAEALPAAVLKAWRAVLPKSALLFPVGGIRPDNMAPYWGAGANGFGTGSNLYAPGANATAVAAAASAYAEAFRALPRRR